MTDLDELIELIETTREKLIFSREDRGEVSLSTDDLRTIANALRYYQYWHDLEIIPNEG